MLDKIAYRFLRLLDPEKAHNIAKAGMKGEWFAPGPFVSSWGCKLFGHKLNNPLGLAAGFDKNGELVDAAIEYGFGFVEVGSVTNNGGCGNPKPRLFRLEDGDLMNRMGLNGDPAFQVARRLEKVRTHAYGVNITKTHNPEIVGDLAILDLVSCYSFLHSFGMYTTLNISCPNTKEGKTFEDPGAFSELMSAIDGIRKQSKQRKPLLVKLSPTLEWRSVNFVHLLDQCRKYKVDGFVLCNTLPFNHPTHLKGGRSGKAIKQIAIRLIREMRRDSVHFPIMGLGGIFTGRDMMDYREAGADFFQAYNGFVLGPNAGVKFAHKVNKEFEALCATSHQ